MTRYALNRKTGDRWPIVFRPDCERTYFDIHGKDEGLFEMMERLAKHGYEIVTYFELMEYLNSK